MAKVPSPLPEKVIEQMKKAGLPQGGAEPFIPRLAKNRKGVLMIATSLVTSGPKAKLGKKGWVDAQGRIWVRDAAHANLPAHWDVRVTGGLDYFRVDDEGNVI